MFLLPRKAGQTSLESRGESLTNARLVVGSGGAGGIAAGLKVRNGDRLLRAQDDGRKREDNTRIPQRRAAPVGVRERGAS